MQGKRNNSGSIPGVCLEEKRYYDIYIYNIFQTHQGCILDPELFLSPCMGVQSISPSLSFIELRVGLVPSKSAPSKSAPETYI